MFITWIRDCLTSSITQQTLYFNIVARQESGTYHKCHICALKRINSPDCRTPTHLRTIFNVFGGVGSGSGDGLGRGRGAGAIGCYRMNFNLDLYPEIPPLLSHVVKNCTWAAFR